MTAAINSAETSLIAYEIMKTEDDSQPATATATAVAKTEEETSKHHDGSRSTISFELHCGKECGLISLNHIRQQFGPNQALLKLITTDLNSKVKTDAEFRTNQQRGDLNVVMMSFKLFGYDMDYIKPDDLKAGCQDDVIGYVVHEKKDEDEDHYYALLQIDKELWNMDSLTLNWPAPIDFDFVEFLYNTENTTVFIVRKKPMAIDWLPKEANSVLSIQGLQSKDEKRVVFHWNRKYLNQLRGSSKEGQVQVKMITPVDAPQIEFEIDQPETNTLQQIINTLDEGVDYEVTLKGAKEPVPKHFWGNIPVKMVFDYSQGMIEIEQIETMKQGATKKRKVTKK